MEPLTLTISPGYLYALIGFASGFVGGWFAGGFYKSHRVQGMTREEVKTLTEERARAYFQVVLNAIKKAKEPPLT